VANHHNPAIFKTQHLNNDRHNSELIFYLHLHSGIGITTIRPRGSKVRGQGNVRINFYLFRDSGLLLNHRRDGCRLRLKVRRFRRVRHDARATFRFAVPGIAPVTSGLDPAAGNGSAAVKLGLHRVVRLVPVEGSQRPASCVFVRVKPAQIFDQVVDDFHVFTEHLRRRRRFGVACDVRIRRRRRCAHYSRL